MANPTGSLTGAVRPRKTPVTKAAPPTTTPVAGPPGTSLNLFPVAGSNSPRCDSERDEPKPLFFKSCVVGMSGSGVSKDNTLSFLRSGAGPILPVLFVKRLCFSRTPPSLSTPTTFSRNRPGFLCCAGLKGFPLRRLTSSPAFFGFGPLVIITCSPRPPRNTPSLALGKVFPVFFLARNTARWFCACCLAVACCSFRSVASCVLVFLSDPKTMSLASLVLIPCAWSSLTLWFLSSWSLRKTAFCLLLLAIRWSLWSFSWARLSCSLCLFLVAFGVFGSSGCACSCATILAWALALSSKNSATSLNFLNSCCASVSFSGCGWAGCGWAGCGCSGVFCCCSCSGGLSTCVRNVVLGLGLFAIGTCVALRLP